MKPALLILAVIAVLIFANMTLRTPDEPAPAPECIELDAHGNMTGTCDPNAGDCLQLNLSGDIIGRCEDFPAAAARP